MVGENSDKQRMNHISELGIETKVGALVRER